MPTFLQQKLAREIIANSKRKKPLNKSQLVARAGYSKEVVEQKPGKTIEADGVIEALNDYGFNIDTAKSVVASILTDKSVDPNPRLKAAEQVFKVHGAYAPEKSINLNVEVESDEVIDDLTQKLNDIYKGTGISGNGESSGALGIEAQN